MSAGTSSRHCAACGVELTDENGYRRKTGSQAGSFEGYCRQCNTRWKVRWEAAHPGYRRNRHLTSTYGITQEDYEARYIAEDGRCYICLKQFKVLCVDHDHVTGRVRGLLCRECNIGIGKLGDRLDRLYRACTYLERYA